MKRSTDRLLRQLLLNDGMNIRTEIHRRRLRAPFVTSRGPRTSQEVLRVEIEMNGLVGRGESSGVGYKGETAASMASQVEVVAGALLQSPVRNTLSELLPPGGARAALDAALWDWEAKSNATYVWQLAGLSAPAKRVRTAYTISVASPEEMALATAKVSSHPLIKVKLGGGDGLDPQRAQAVRENAPDAVLIADCNGGVAADEVGHLAEQLHQLGYDLLEQPLKAGEDHRLNDLDLPIPLCADESLDTVSDLARISPSYAFGNIKLDKAGGLTAALELKQALQAAGMGVFIGGMITGALGAAPAFLLCDGAAYVDLDGPIWLAEDEILMELDEEGYLAPPGPEIWGV